MLDSFEWLDVLGIQLKLAREINDLAIRYTQYASKLEELGENDLAQIIRWVFLKRLLFSAQVLTENLSGVWTYETWHKFCEVCWEPIEEWKETCSLCGTDLDTKKEEDA